MGRHELAVATILSEEELAASGLQVPEGVTVLTSEAVSQTLAQMVLRDLEKAEGYED